MTKNLSTRTRVIVLIGAAALAGFFFLFYEQLRRSHRDDFPFLWEPLFLHGLLLIGIGALAMLSIKIALEGGRGTTILAAVLIGVPSAALAFASYAITVLDLSFVPDRLVGEGFHEMGMLGLGVALVLLILAFTSRQPAPTENDS